jgi:molybdenum cofactor synthesis domain-containing protein
MIPIHEAFQVIDEKMPKLSTEFVSLEDSLHRVLAEDIKADSDLPPFDRSQMDGFAIRADDTKMAPARLKLIGQSIAGKGFDGEVKPGEAVKIMTGARVPKGADAVQKLELAREINGFVEILEPASPRQNIVAMGEEIKEGTKIFSAGELITEHMIPTLAAFGYAHVKVFRQPKIWILSTGTELVEIHEKPNKDQIRNSNSIMLKVFLKNIALNATILRNIADDEKLLAETIHQEVISEDSEGKVLITTGGVSVGEYDFTKSALRSLGAEIFFEKVSIKPGKPTVFAKLKDCFVFGLPGNPVSAAVTFYLFARRAILRMQGANRCDLEDGFAIVTKKIKSTKERDSVLPAFVSTDEKGQMKIESLRFAGSSNFIEFARANSLVYVPKGKDLHEGETAKIWFLR